MRRRLLTVLATAVLVVAPALPASAHNHLANPSGLCNGSGMGTSPGNSGETSANPAGKPVARAKAGALTATECLSADTP